MGLLAPTILPAWLLFKGAKLSRRRAYIQRRQEEEVSLENAGCTIKAMDYNDMAGGTEAGVPVST